MSPLYERAAEMLLAELHRGLPPGLVENDLAACGVPIRDTEALVAFMIAQRSDAIIADLTGARSESKRGRPPSPLLRQSVLFAAFQYHERSGQRRTHAMGAAAATLGTTKDVVEKAVRAIEGRTKAGDELAAAVVSLAVRILPIAVAETKRDAASAAQARRRERHIPFPPECPPFSARPAAR